MLKLGSASIACPISESVSGSVKEKHHCHVDGLVRILNIVPRPCKADHCVPQTNACNDIQML